MMQPCLLTAFLNPDSRFENPYTVFDRNPLGKMHHIRDQKQRGWQ